jgi:hypothetical protein
MHCQDESWDLPKPTGHGDQTPMSIRMIAKDLYQLICEVKSLEKQIDDTPYENQADMKDQLRKLLAERNRMRKVLEGCKDPK